MKNRLFLITLDTRDTPCPNCKAFSISITSKNLLNYFLGAEIKCLKCETKLDWWELLIRHFDSNFSHNLYGIIGGLRTIVRINMKPNEIYKLDLNKCEIPSNAKVLEINYTPLGKGLFPQEMHGNIPYRHFIPHKIYLYGRPLGEFSDEIQVEVSIIWIKVDDENQLWSNLVEAVEAFLINKYPSCIIPANVAVEAKLNKLLDDYLSRYASNKRVTDFLTSGATYSHQLNVLLPLVANFEKFPILPEHIRGELNILRDYRNNIAHKGVTVKPLNKTITGKLLCAATFALGYLFLLEKRITGKD